MRAANYSLWVRLTWLTFIILIFLLALKCKLKMPRLDGSALKVPPMWEQSLDFNVLQLNNETGNPSGCYLVPNYIHYLTFGGEPVSYVQLICILAAFKNQQPEKMFFHYDMNTTFTGKYWNVLQRTPGFLRVVEYNKVDLPDSIFGQSLSADWRAWHGSDIMRIRTVMKYGGIFLDNDCYLVKKVDEFRKYEISMNWDDGQFLGSQVIIAHKDARFLARWLDTYRAYDSSKWYYNAGERPTIEVLYKEPGLIHRVKESFGAHIKFAFKVFQEQWEGWKGMYVVHLLARHQYLFKNVTRRAVFPVQFNETNIAYYPVSFRDMAYDVYDTANIKWLKYKFDT